jgi:ATPase subunit of ABC transporter with duplicated ATPase domains
VLSLARAFVGNPRVLVLDDPTAYLDVRGVAVFERIVTRHRGTVLIATHDPEVIRLADRVWRMDRGTLTEERVSANTHEAGHMLVPRG